jgi:hypothetical protein
VRRQAFPLGGSDVQHQRGSGLHLDCIEQCELVTFAGPSSETGNGTSLSDPANTRSRSHKQYYARRLLLHRRAGERLHNRDDQLGRYGATGSAGNWKTAITLLNTGSAAAKVRLSFFDDNGSPHLPLTFPQAPLAAGPLFAAVLDRTINPGAPLIETRVPMLSPYRWAGRNCFRLETSAAPRYSNNA